MRTKLSVYVFGLSAIFAGAVDIVWGGFDPGHQPLQAFGDHIPGARILAYIVATLLVIGGLAILRTASRRLGANIVIAVYILFAIFWLPRFVTAPHYLGYHAGVYIGVSGGVCEQLIVIGGAMIVAGAMNPVIRWIFGVSAIAFGLAQITGIAATAAMVPNWIPPNANFWAVLTGIAFVLAGIAILIRTCDKLASQLLAVMLLIFSVLVLAPLIATDPHDFGAWGANAYNIVALASVWVYASRITAGGQRSTFAMSTR